ncbi:MAG: AmmeMemoRadiSam system radical SAM enzyme [Bacteroidales bacterium]|nr:AmmeMemoRadiSam system radical SAM enzyme [Bacteroidales bacterium]MBN2764291.1 AmmeMemoRadiSam system radical SAM enzyme [Bacteroidales bacterium]
MKEAMFYSSTPVGVKCLICPNGCSLKEGEVGDCRNRMNIKGKLYSIAYGNPCAVHVDPIEKKPLFNFLPGTRSYSIATAGCNLSCLNCQNWEISQASPLETRNYDLMPQRVVEEAINHKCASIAYTYSEPVTFYEYTYDTSKIARSKGIKNIIVSAGYINEKPLRELAKYIDAANIDLKSFSDEIYMKLNGGTLQPVLRTLKVLKEMNVWLEITNLVIPSWTDDFSMIAQMCKWLHDNGFDDTPLHFSRFHPQYKLTQLPATPLSTLLKSRDIARKAGLKYVYIGNAPGLNSENTICPKCGKIVVERKGFSIITNNIVNTRCKFCNTPIAGVWQ